MFPANIFQAAYPESVLSFDDVAVEDRGLHVTGNGDDPCDGFFCRWRDGVSHLFQEVFSMDPSLPSCKETVLSVQTVLGLDLTR